MQEHTNVSGAGAYTCPMHPEVVRDAPGACPLCGMALERVSGRQAPEQPTVGKIDWPLHRALRARAAGWAFVAGSLLFVVYVATLSFANSLDHLGEELAQLWPWMVPIIVGFALQVGLFAYARGATRVHAGGAHARGVVASGGASTVSMLACCAHHVSDALPLFAFAGAASFLATYQRFFLLLGVLSNVAGVVHVLGLMRRHGLYPSRSSFLSGLLRWPFERTLIPVLIVALIILLTGGCSKTGSSYATRSSTGDIAFDVTPRGMVDGRFIVDIGVNTHSGDLADLDLTKVFTLVSDGQEIHPVQADRLVGHHASSAVAFQMDSAPKQFELVLRGARSLPDQRFQWP